MVKHSAGQQSVANRRKTGFLRDIPFSKITFWKKKTLTSLVNYSTLLSSTGITFQNKEKYLTQYNYSILQLEYFFLHNSTNDFLGSLL